jgi:SAM-dependent methyltransferase
VTGTEGGPDATIESMPEDSSSKTAGYYESDRSAFLNWVGGAHERVLDIGCGAGSNAAWYRGHGAHEIVGVEPVPAAARLAVAVLDRVIGEPIETALVDLVGPFDLVVCADVLEHLIDPWSITRRLRRLAGVDTVLAVSMPNIRFLPAVARIAVGRGFAYEDHGIFDSTHLRFFTRANADSMLRRAGWLPVRWGAPPPGRLGGIRRTARRLSGGRSDDWLAGQIYVVARPANGSAEGTRSRGSSSIAS